MSRTTGRLISEAEHIEQSIAEIILTLEGSRVGRRTYGSRVPLFLGRPVASVLPFSAAAAEALAEFEPRIEVERISLKSSSLKEGRGVWEVVYRALGERRTLSIGEVAS